MGIAPWIHGGINPAFKPQNEKQPVSGCFSEGRGLSDVRRLLALTLLAGLILAARLTALSACLGRLLTVVREVCRIIFFAL
jgi:hypothetical protein